MMMVQESDKTQQREARTLPITTERAAGTIGVTRQRLLVYAREGRIPSYWYVEGKLVEKPVGLHYRGREVYFFEEDIETLRPLIKKRGQRGQIDPTGDTYRQYQRKYYEEVIKPRRQAQLQERQAQHDQTH